MYTASIFCIQYKQFNTYGVSYGIFKVRNNYFNIYIYSIFICWRHKKNDDDNIKIKKSSNLKVKKSNDWRYLALVSASSLFGAYITQEYILRSQISDGKFNTEYKFKSRNSNNEEVIHPPGSYSVMHVYKTYVSIHGNENSGNIFNVKFQ